MSHPEQERTPLDVERIREDFPILEREVRESDLVYLDNAATSQTPEPVIEAMDECYREYYSNVHRGIHTLSEESSIAYEEAHERLAEFVGASGGLSEMVFTKNTTEGLNLVAQGWGLRELGADDAVVLSELEHHSSLVTWQQIAKRTGASVRYIRVDEDGRLDMDHAAELIDGDAAVVSVAHVSNTLGVVNPVAELADLAHAHDALFVVDGAQAVPTRPVDVEVIDADFYAFSGHKMAGPTGIGGLYGKAHLLEDLEPFVYGGGMVERVTFDDTTWAEVPWRFEAGTPPIVEGIGLAAAAEYLDDLGMERIQAHEERLAGYCYDRLDELGDVELYGPPPGADRTGLVAFNLADVHAHDLASIVNDHGVAIRAGDHCTQPLHDRLAVPASARASFYIYNTAAEVDRLVEALADARELFG